MRNAVITIVGQKGSGKTTFAKALAALSTRHVIIDRLWEYEEGDIMTNYEHALERLAQLWRRDFRIVVRFRQDQFYSEYFHFLAEVSDRCPFRPVSVTVEEADFFMSPHKIDPHLSYLYRYGRHFKINLISIARGETDIHRDAVANADCFVVFRSHRFSTEMRERFEKEDLQRIRELETLVPGTTPEKDVHYVTYPANVDPFAMWKAVQA